jgi:hypothetical protein
MNLHVLAATQFFINLLFGSEARSPVNSRNLGPVLILPDGVSLHVLIPA